MANAPRAAAVTTIVLALGAGGGLLAISNRSGTRAAGLQGSEVAAPTAGRATAPRTSTPSSSPSAPPTSVRATPVPSPPIRPPSARNSTATGTAPATPVPTGSLDSAQASPTIGLTNFAPVTITAVNVPSGSYDVGQCPAAARAGDLSKCLLLSIVNVDAGRLAATVDAFWWIDSGRIDCGVAAGACVVGVRSTDPRSAVAPVAFDLTFDPAKRPTIGITPDSGLADHQSVEVRGSNVGSGTVSYSECLADQWASCTYATAAVGSSGSFASSFTVQRALRWSLHGTLPASGECGFDGNCVVVAWITPNGFESSGPYRVMIEPTQGVRLTFAPTTPSTTTSLPGSGPSVGPSPLS